MSKIRDTHYYLGVDAGGTSCRARLVDKNGTILGAGKSGPATIARGADFAARSIKACIKEAIAAAGLTMADLADTSLAVGAAGTESSNKTSDLEARLALLDAAHFTLTSDARTACLGAHGGGDGGVVIVGTGSIGYALVGGKTVRTGGFGFPVSDLGSGAHIGLAAVQYALSKAGHQSSCDFAAAILRAVGTTNNQIAAWTANATATDYASFAPLVVDHAVSGNIFAADILKAAAGHIAALVSKLHILGAPSISLIGGLSAIIEPLIEQRVQMLLSPAKGDPIDGAILLARTLQ